LFLMVALMVVVAAVVVLAELALVLIRHHQMEALVALDSHGHITLLLMLEVAVAE
jgi:hypothetical protein